MTTNQDNQSTFGDRLRILRTEKNLNQAAFGELIGELMGTKRVSSSAVGAYERNEREPTYEMLRTMARYFNVSMDYLLCTSDYRFTVENYIGMDSHELKHILDEYTLTLNGEELSSADKQRLLDIATTLLWRS